MIPRKLGPELMQEAHGQTLTGHDGISKSKEMLLSSYFWPNIAQTTLIIVLSVSQKKDQHHAPFIDTFTTIH